MDDFIVSPPSLDDGGFLRLRYGRTSHTDAATHDRSQDVGMTVEVCVGGEYVWGDVHVGVCVYRWVGGCVCVCVCVDCIFSISWYFFGFLVFCKFCNA